MFDNVVCSDGGQSGTHTRQVRLQMDRAQLYTITECFGQKMSAAYKIKQKQKSNLTQQHGCRFNTLDVAIVRGADPA